ncbi:class 1b ribonucleoside-diphosphate reductase subunit alpha [Streptobacillus moniliformis]|uniref:Ribonucleoside-diphosphate reductase n=1 Tax=Streptobacillus moniliformis (strain ATCC 14647 / DSM 12112 / NCTC 10651 / 9901) TaxID=519441 RepID=D1AXJ5_STRM9|nr:class 1b ribonucleoside-diphosphate reductase subunit alpha [Streptobacillus moniliformis]ACZ01021.1 ribonucleoside-diphosphate reductase, alpha subunit [Streptobacillus moniliformis DSM 12112]AVL42608.1 class 1b ribonucleoside-diphosphate reductase subunit alpha [Streptobacillus moniliformis]QXW65803.1 class 1b ribonucleoside-diphosphate reductase subunit alpha [Streptobacillus moniliformis]SQA13840.1 Ribonucleoside-diphosphate reductase subunit alpha 2 [Streptobacillus moniliformis]
MKWVYLNNEIMVKDSEGKLQIEKDKEAVYSYFIDYINKNTVFFHNLKEKIDYLIEKDYYINFYDMYSFEEINEVFKFVYSKKFRFKSYMAASKFYQSYALMDDTGEKILERYEDRISIVALYLGQGNKEKALKYAKMLINQEYQPATPTFLNAGKKRSGELVSCFLDEIGDNLSGIGYAFESAMKLSSIGGGVAFNISKLRARGEAIKGVEGRASGVLPIMKILEDIFSYANQLGQRPGAGAVYLNVFHSDILEFLDTKKINVDEKIRIKSLSIGVIISDKFMELASADLPCYTFYPHSVYLEYGKYLDDLDMNEWYEKLVANPKVKKKKINVREFLVKVAQTQKESGYPYLFFKDNANREHALKEIGDVKFTNLCTEIMQLTEVSDINNYYEEDNIRRGISCNLGSVNIAKVMENKSIKEVVKNAIDSLTTVSDLTNISIVPSIKKANDELSSVGLGAMNLHGYLAKNMIQYESREALDFCNVFFMMMNYYSLERSMEIAKERSRSFLGFEKSEYANGKYFEKYITKEYMPVTDRVKELFEGIHIPGVEEWKKLKEDVMKYGVYNAYRMAIAPNQSTSYIMNATASVMPIVDKVEVREYGDSTTFYPMPYLNYDNFFYYKSAYDMDQKNILKLISVIQRHVDQGISTILFTKSNDTTRDLSKLYILAHKLGLKSLYYTRTRKSTIEECLSCSV